MMMIGQVEFGLVVGQIGLARSPEKAKFVLIDTIVLEPVELHDHGFGSFGLDATVGDAFGSDAVSLDGCRGLGISQLLKYVAYFHSFLGLEVSCTKFCFSS
jgi:hypothetical protein